MNSSAYRTASETPPAPSAHVFGIAESRGVRVIRAEQLSASDISQWSALEARAIEPNPYMSPHFVLPALRFLDPQADVEIWFARRSDDDHTGLIGVCAFLRRRGSRRFPFPHLEAYQSVHSFLSGPLLDQTHAAQALEQMLDVASSVSAKGLAVVLPCVASDGPIAKLMDNWAQRHATQAHRRDSHARALLLPGQAGPGSIKASLGSKVNEMARNRRRLSQIGPCDWRSLRPTEPAPAIETFLALEHRGWKAEAGSSLRSNADHEAFFRDMTTGFAREGRAWFTELSLNGQAIASTCNFISGGAGFAFKVGWNEDYRKYGVGILNEVHLVENAPEVCSDLAYIDSGAAPGSFIDSLWPARRQLSTLVLPLGRLGQGLWRIAEAARAAKAGVRRLRRGPPGAESPSNPAAPSLKANTHPPAH
jgi:CelD/BcsL family acetyltransferase involved in cellulose biosynthesis